MSDRPYKMTLKMYQVGFGDCFLMTFSYKNTGGKGDSKRHILIDFGSTGAPKSLSKGLLDRVAADIKKTVGGQLDIVVATHRHADHINGFTTTKDGNGSGNVIRSCKPKLVLQPWTEDPKAQKDATKPTQNLSPDHLHIRSLSNMNQVAKWVINEFRSEREPGRKSLQAQLTFIGDVNLANKSAVTNLMTMGSKTRYLYFGADPETAPVLPGVRVHVIGPPTLEQSDKIRKQRAKDEAEFWHLMGLTSSAHLADGEGPFSSKLALKRIPPASRWIARRVRRLRGEQLLALVRILDSAMNNTSLILLFEVGKSVFLFPGDAQIENWSYALEQARKNASLRSLLTSIDLYKVGHHGSLNATPHSLWNMFAKKGDRGKKGRLNTALSTMAGKHGSTNRRTEVPRKTLVEELEKQSNLSSTQELKKSELFKSMEFTL